jgi:hypothetical protein
MIPILLVSYKQTKKDKSTEYIDRTLSHMYLKILKNYNGKKCREDYL